MANRERQVFVLLVEVGRKASDGLPEGATGAGLLCLAAAVDEAEAVRETVAVLKQADLAPLDVTGYGTLSEAAEQGVDLGDDAMTLADRALAENAVLVIQSDVYRD